MRYERIIQIKETLNTEEVNFGDAFLRFNKIKEDRQNTCLGRRKNINEYEKRNDKRKKRE